MYERNKKRSFLRSTGASSIRDQGLRRAAEDESRDTLRRINFSYGLPAVLGSAIDLMTPFEAPHQADHGDTTDNV